MTVPDPETFEIVVSIPLFRKIILSATVKFCALTVVVVPVTVRFPPTVTLPVVWIVVNLPVLGVVAPIGVPSIAPPVMATLFAFCVAIVPNPSLVRAFVGVVFFQTKVEAS